MPILIRRTSGLIEPVPYFKFPAGEVHIRNFDISDVEQVIFNWRGDHTDLAVLASLYTMCDIPLLVPYLPASRADRVQGNESLGKEAYVDLIAAAIRELRGGASLAFTWDMHSSTPISLLIKNIPRMHQYMSTQALPLNSVLLAPDKGAIQRVAQIAESMGLPSLFATKLRDYNTGRLTGVSVPDELYQYDHIFVIDDICDGGGTFIQLAQAIQKPSTTLHLYVTHGIFSKGKSELEQYYSTIVALNDWTTDTLIY